MQQSSPCSRTSWVAITIALAMLLASGCGGGCRRAGGDGRLNVVIVLADTLRADHMSAYGYRRATTPYIDSLLSESVLFEHTRSQAACTFPSTNSLLTSRWPVVFNRQEQGEMGIPEGVPSIAEILAGQGWSTAAVSASPIVRATPTEVNPKGGFGRGFEVFDESCLWGAAACVNRVALRQLGRLQQPFLLYLHYMDPHDPYDPPGSYQRQFAGSYDGPEWVKEGNPNPISEMLYGDGPNVEFSVADLDHLVGLYDDEIAYFDQQLGKLVDTLRRRRLLDSTIFVLLADHGEEFYTHGHIKHGWTLFDTSSRTPLIIRIPGVQGGRRIEAAVQNLDVVPTILDYLGVSVPGVELSGRSLRPLLEPGGEWPGIAFSSQGKWRSVDNGALKVILDGLSGDMQVYDLKADPDELHDLSPSDERAHPLMRELRPWLSQSAGGVSRKSIDLALAKQEELRALGYLE